MSELFPLHNGEDEDTIHDKDAAATCIDGNSSNRNAKPLQDAPRARKARTTKLIYALSGFSVISGFLFGYDMGAIAGALLTGLDNLSSTQKELLFTISFATAALGALGGGLLNEKMGRKRTIMIASAIFGMGVVIMAGAPSASWGWSIVLIGRLIVGIGIGK